MKKIMFNDRFNLTKLVLEGRKTQTRRLELDCNTRFIFITMRVHIRKTILSRYTTTVSKVR